MVQKQAVGSVCSRKAKEILGRGWPADAAIEAQLAEFSTVGATDRATRVTGTAFGDENRPVRDSAISWSLEIKHFLQCISARSAVATRKIGMVMIVRRPDHPSESNITRTHRCVQPFVLSKPNLPSSRHDRNHWLARADQGKLGETISI